jgi:hypothetical protein
MNPVASTHARQAADIANRWPKSSRRRRRAGARWWWKSCTRTEHSWPEQWRSINANHGVVDFLVAA